MIIDPRITKAPNHLNLIGNPLIVKLEPLLLPAAASEPAQLVIEFLGYTSIKVGDAGKFDIDIAGNLVTFVFEEDISANNIDPHLLPEVKSTDVLFDWVNELYLIIASEYFIEKYTDVTVFENFITITAKEIGLDKGIFVPNGNLYRVNFEITNLPSEKLINDTNLFLSIIDINNNRISEDILSISNNEASIDISEYLKVKITDAFNWHEAQGKDFIIPLPDSVFPFKLMFTEIKDSVFQKLYKPETIYYAINGGLSREDQEFFQNEESNYFDFAYNRNKLLTWQPDEKIIHPKQPEKLFFFTDSHSQLKLKVSVFNTDGTGQDKDITTLTAVEQNSIVEIQCGFSKLELAEIDTTKTIDKYIIHLEDYNGNSIFTRTYYVDSTQYPDEKHFIFKNSFGKWDTLRCIGGIVNTTKGERTTSIHSDELGSIGKDINAVHTKTYKVNMGYCDLLCGDPKLYTNYLNELMRTTEAFEIKGDWITPINITSKKTKKKLSTDNIYDFEFEYQYSSADEFFSAEVGEGFEYLLDESGDILEDENGVKLYD